MSALADACRADPRGAHALAPLPAAEIGRNLSGADLAASCPSGEFVDCFAGSLSRRFTVLEP
eukprot:6595171-Prymnesium_polylepis.1